MMSSAIKRPYMAAASISPCPKILSFETSDELSGLSAICLHAAEATRAELIPGE